MQPELMLSIYVPVYNHEHYIEQALDSILMQKTKYSYEVWVGEDCSTDKTREILKEYEHKHPGFFKILYRERNMHNEKINNIMDLKLRCTGKYLICLEGDDYWIDEKKIETQIDFLEAHPEYLGVAHNCIVVDENSEETLNKYPECKETEYTINHFCNNILPGQTTTLMARNYMCNEYFDTSLVRQKLHIGDRLIYFSLISNGRIYCIQKAMSAYRFVKNSGTSFSATYKYDYNIEKKYCLALIEYAYKINNIHAVLCAEITYSIRIAVGVIKKSIPISVAITDLLKIKHKHIIVKSFFQMIITGKIKIT